jgi:hypothetical protein
MTTAADAPAELAAFFAEVERFFGAIRRLGAVASASADPEIAQRILAAGEEGAAAMLAIVRLALGEEGYALFNEASAGECDRIARRAIESGSPAHRH